MCNQAGPVQGRRSRLVEGSSLPLHPHAIFWLKKKQTFFYWFPFYYCMPFPDPPLKSSHGSTADQGALCVQMDFMRTFQTNTKCNNINHVCSHFYNIFVILKYHRCLWANIFDTDIYRCINTYIKVVYWAFLGIFMLLQMSVSKILADRRLWYFKTTKILQKWQNMIYIVAFGVGLKCPRKRPFQHTVQWGGTDYAHHISTCPPPGFFGLPTALKLIRLSRSIPHPNKSSSESSMLSFSSTQNLNRVSDYKVHRANDKFHSVPKWKIYIRISSLLQIWYWGMTTGCWHSSRQLWDVLWMT